MRIVSDMVVAGGESPARRTVSHFIQWIRDAVSAIDQGVLCILFPIIGIIILQVTRIKPQVRIMREKKRSTIRVSQWQGISVIGIVIDDIAGLCPTIVIHGGHDRMCRRTGRQEVRDQTLIIAPDLVIHLPSVIR